MSPVHPVLEESGMEGTARAKALRRGLPGMQEGRQSPVWWKQIEWGGGVRGEWKT